MKYILWNLSSFWTGFREGRWKWSKN